MFHFRRFQSRLLLFVIVLLLLAQGGFFYAVNRASYQNAHDTIDRDLDATASTFRQTLDSRSRILFDKARLLSADFAFKQAFSTGEHDTLLSALRNHQNRVGADVMMLFSMDGKVLADTLHADAGQDTFSDRKLIDAVLNSDRGEIEAVETINGSVYQVVMVPLFTPEPSALILIGFAMDNDFAKRLGRTANDTEVSLLKPDEQGAWTLFASTLPSGLAGQLRAQSAGIVSQHASVTLDLSGSPYVSLPVAFSNQGTGPVAVLQRSLLQQLQPYFELRRTLLLIFLLSMGVSGLAAVFLARSVVSPVKVLEQGAQAISRGEFGHRVTIDAQDELGRLAASFNLMGKGLQERDRVRDLLGKVVSPEIAAELLNKEIVLGGEEREVTVLFSDIRSFTTLCENLAPKQVIEMLNTYLTRINAVIEANQGVVDKYIGDAVMALFGAPLAHEQAAPLAVRAGLDMLAATQQLSREFAAQGLPPINIGVGLNTDVVLAGNMGSASRMNYTVIGDGVNLASRLEGLGKYYGVEMVVSAATRSKAEGFVYRELDMVRVKGKHIPVEIFEPLAAAGQLSPGQESELADYRQALHWYRARRWQDASSAFTSLDQRFPGTRLYQLYRERAERLRASPPDADWDGVYAHAEK